MVTNSFIQTPNGHEIHVAQWPCSFSFGTIVIMPGLARHCRDHDELAEWLSNDYHVISVDLIGRGMSTWAKDPSEYCWDTYMECLYHVLNTLNIHRFVWIGTSMGAALGIHATSRKNLDYTISALILNDMGPEVPDAAFDHILSYAETPPIFNTMQEYEQFLMKTYVGRGFATNKTWNRLATYGHRRTNDGKITVHNDPKIVEQIRSKRSEYKQWNDFENITIPIMCIRGQESKLLTTDIVDRMMVVQPNMQLIIEPNCGHAPGLNIPRQINKVKEFVDNVVR